MKLEKDFISHENLKMLYDTHRAALTDAIKLWFEFHWLCMTSQ